MKEKSEKEKMTKGLLLLPLIATPFLTLIFWALGGGQNQSATQKPEAKNVLQTELPDARMKDKRMNKMSYYEAALADSIKKESQIKTDPYYQYPTQEQLPFGSAQSVGFPPNENYAPVGVHHGNGYGPFNQVNPGYNSQEAKVYDKLNALNSAINQQDDPRLMPGNNALERTGTAVNSADIDRLEKMMTMMQSGNQEGDPEMAQINGMLEKILDIQNPQRAQEKFNKESAQKRGQVYLVTAPVQHDPISLLVNTSRTQQAAAPGFFSIEENLQAATANGIAAVVHENQTLTNGSTVKLRLLDDIVINGLTVPRDNFVFGLAEISGERLNIHISSIRYKNTQFTVNLNVYDIDGMDGIHVPGAISREVAKESGNSALSGMGMGGIDQSLGVQAASAGIEFSKNLIGRKVKQVKIYLKAGYRLLLKDANEK